MTMTTALSSPPPESQHNVLAQRGHCNGGVLINVQNDCHGLRTFTGAPFLMHLHWCTFSDAPPLMHLY